MSAEEKERIEHLRWNGPACVACGQINGVVAFTHDEIIVSANENCPAPADSRAGYIIAAGFHQVSRKYRRVARLPPGKKTGKEALLAAINSEVTIRPEYWIPENERWVGILSEREAKDQYLRVHAPMHDHMTLDKETFAAFLNMGGRAL